MLQKEGVSTDGLSVSWWKSWQGKKSGKLWRDLVCTTVLEEDNKVRNVVGRVFLLRTFCRNWPVRRSPADDRHGATSAEGVATCLGIGIGIGIGVCRAQSLPARGEREATKMNGHLPFAPGVSSRLRTKNIFLFFVINSYFYFVSFINQQVS